jgi:hypothetical protein
MTGSGENPLLRASAGEIDRWAQHLALQEKHLASSLDPGTDEILKRLATAVRHLRAARVALTGVAAPEEPRLEHLQGSCPRVPIQELVSFLANTEKSGVLRVEGESERYVVQLERGSVVYAAGDAPPSGQGLSELLAALGVHSAELLGRLPGAAASNPWVEPNLVGTSWIARETLTSALVQQTRLSFFRLCSTRRARFHFYEGARIENVIPVRQNATELLLEHTRALDESGSGGWSAVRTGGAGAPQPVEHAA